MIEDLPEFDVPELDLSEQRVSQLLGDIKRNSRNRRIAMVAPVVLVAAVLGAMIAAPSQHGGLALVADAETSDPQLPRVFGSNGVWRLAEPIEEIPAADPGPADMIEAPTEPSAPQYSLSPPDQEDFSSLPTSTSTPPMSTSGQFEDATSPADLDWSQFSAVIRIEPQEAEESANLLPTPAPQLKAEDTTTPDNVTVAVEPQTELEDQAEANPSTPTDDPTDSELQAFTAPANIVPQSVLVYSAHVSVTVQVVDDDSSVIDWCNTRVDWGDGSVTRVAGADDAALCTASCEYEATSSEASSILAINALVQFEHDYVETIDASPRIFVATGDGCSYTLAELQLPPFTVVPLP